MDWHIECRNVWKVFGRDPAGALSAIRSGSLDKAHARKTLNHVVGVADASLQIPRGEIFCIMGLSGSGKSTLLRHINRLIEPTAGTRVAGADVGAMDRRALSRLRSETIGMVFQHMALWPHRTLEDNVAYGLEVRGMARAERRRLASEALGMMKLDGWEGHYPDELSGGMQQRVGLARALAADPAILLMDEPFSALDPIIRRDLQIHFLDLSARLNKTTVFVTHDLDEAVRLGDRIAIMRDGHIVQVGTREEIILHPADAYVAEFVRPMSRSRFVRAVNVMLPPLDAIRRPDHIVLHDADLRTIAAKLAGARAPIGVERDGAIVGIIDSYALIDAITAAEPPANA